MKNKVIRAVLILASPIWISFYKQGPYEYLIWAINGYLISIIATAWLVIKEDNLIKQIGNDLLYCLILQGPAIAFEITYLINLTDKQQNNPLLILFIILLNIIFVILFDCLIQQVDFKNIMNRKV
ncbi:hypothetical protein [Lactobacillus xylocopicola]|uniref:Uncharacterized protein n=1 Tax=Lactobacillus xylocopicola TaxID=2976676 RepID=A0ABM8BFF9_9LACO|nr:hypothetical protein [Lactobacillus xylocopicola]BDR59949.1 hypothetical protein KIM322_02100 [Lactobacillus xylocopicola]